MVYVRKMPSKLYQNSSCSLPTITIILRAQQFSRSTAERAVAELCAAGLIESHRHRVLSRRPRDQRPGNICVFAQAPELAGKVRVQRADADSPAMWAAELIWLNQGVINVKSQHYRE